ncbi:TetR/AcrR family transcriptional regulator [Nonomuraea lactucae]|uniref:TetR/AcrR family transcriptional regulator n=1 Tax=Nonomuraea lactucae TaxID=2249762 RepID=UPI000DE2D8A3|nr:TetR/AcrR family transcriptional regulator [Nonomuraea lactucae]
MGTNSDRSVGPASQKRGRRARDSLSRAIILEAAEKIATSEGLESLTFQALGKELSAHPTSIYRHFRDKDELVLELIDSLRSRSYGGNLQKTGSWRDDLRLISRHVREHYLRYPQLAFQMAARTTRRPMEFANVEFALDALLRAGLSPDEAVLHLRAFGNVVRSLSSMEASLLALDAETRKRDELAWEVEYRQLPAEEYPHIASLAGQLTGVGDPRIFDLAIELILDAIELHVSRRPVTPAEPEH